MALQGLHCLDAQGAHVLDLVEAFIDDSREEAPVIYAARKLLRDAYDARAETDKLFARHARHWDIERLAAVDRNILRLAVYELRVGRTPYKVVISEAIRLAQEFSTAESPRFVNGILDAVARELSKRGEEPSSGLTEPSREE